MTQDSHTYVKWFRQSSPYINAHRGRTFVVMLPGAAIQDPNFSNIIHDLGLLHSLGVRLVVVHGVRPQIDARLGERQLSARFHHQWRVTEPDHINLIAQAVGEVRFSIEAALSTGLPNSPLHGAHIRVLGGNFVTAKPMGVIDGVDLQHTGLVRRIDLDMVRQALSANAITLLSPLGYSPTGEIFNLSFAEVATHAAIRLKADKLIAYTSDTGFVNDDGELLRELSVSECAKQLQQLAEINDRSQSLQACYDACINGVPRAQMVSYREDGALLQELFTRDGSGTLIHRDNYEVVRQATIDDVGGLLELLEPLERSGALVRRSRELLEAEIGRFTVMEKDGAIIACAALYPFPDSETGRIPAAELACVATHTDYRNGGRAASVLQAIERHAKSLGIEQLFILTTQTAHWFIEQGFTPSERDCLPSEKKQIYNLQRNSKVFIKQL